MKLAINGAPPVRTTPFPPYKTIGGEEKQAVSEVLDSGVLSRYLGCWHDDFMGGPKVRELETKWAERFGVKHAIAVNSCTSGLYCAVGAAGISPGDEVIVSPYTMSASATATLVYGATPVFADIEEDCFCLDPASVEERITTKTKAIIVVDIFGLPYDTERINAIAAKHGLVVIEDCAQAPGAELAGKPAGTLGDMGVFSLNYHKHIHCGEGGVIVTDDDALAKKLRLIRNHAEAVVEEMGFEDLKNMVGFNYRMTEMEAAVAICQLEKLPGLIEERIANCEYLEEKIEGIPALTMPAKRPEAKHVYYTHSIKFDEKTAGIPRNHFVDAVKAELPHTTLREAEGVLMGCGYVKPIYLMPLYLKRQAIYPLNSNARYEVNLCPVTERMHFKELFSHEMMRPGMTRNDLDDVAEAFLKVWVNIDELR